MSIDQEKIQIRPSVEKVSLDQEPDVPKRITAGLIKRTRAELQALMGFEGLGVTDVVNRAISLYYVVAAHRRAGYEMVFRHPDTGTEREILF
jgi:hypothetical protein